MPPSPQLLDSKFFSLPDGKRMRYALFEPENPKGTILIAPGRREFIEKKYAEMGVQLLLRGFRLIFFEWRGQGLSDRPLLGTRHQRDHITDFRTHLDDLNSFYEKTVKSLQTGPLFVSGHSMGSHLFLRWLVEYRPTVKAAILTAPMMALAGHVAHSTARGISWMAMHLGYSADYAPAQHDYDASDKAFANNPLTQDPQRFKIMEDFFTAYPELTVGGISWGWLDAALKSMHTAHNRHYFEHVQLPILTLTGGDDHVTPPAETTRYLKRIPHAANIIVPGARHDLLNELDIYRTEAWRQVDAFLQKIT